MWVPSGDRMGSVKVAGAASATTGIRLGAAGGCAVSGVENDAAANATANDNDLRMFIAPHIRIGQGSAL